MTLEYYENNADNFINNTLNVDVSELYAPFIENLNKGDLIMDVGCGSGRDSLAFINMGFDVISIDASAAMANFASKLIKQKVKCIPFKEINYTDTFHGIWACASLLHVRRTEILGILTLLIKSLKINGCLYMSFKYGNGERQAPDGRFFLDLNETIFLEIIAPLNNISVKKLWITEDQREHKKMTNG